MPRWFPAALPAQSSTDMNELKSRLDTLCVFRDLLQDPVIASLRAFLDAPDGNAYAGFVSALYAANGGNIGAYVRSVCADSCNVYVQTVGKRQIPPAHLRAALTAELETLQAVADLTPDKLCALFEHDGFLPGFTTDAGDLAKDYLHRTDNIGRYGYGVFAGHGMFLVDADGGIVPVRHPDKTALSQLIGYERERKIVLDNTHALLAGKPAANILLTGDAGTGKSSTVKAVANALCDEGLRIVAVRKDQLYLIPQLLDTLSENPLKFILFIDDLSFAGNDDNFGALKAVLEGSVTARSENVVIYATSNRRHMVRETFSDREGDEVHRNDTMQEQLSLSERFGIHISFSKPDKATFLHIVRHLARESGISMPDEELDLLAERFALSRGSRSPRLAKQFVDGLLAEP